LGERALIEEGGDKRAGTAICTNTGPGNEPCIVMTLTKQDYLRFVENVQMKA